MSGVQNIANAIFQFSWIFTKTADVNLPKSSSSGAQNMFSATELEYWLLNRFYLLN